MVYESVRYLALGHKHPKQACYINCSARCQAYARSEPDIFYPARTRA
jgi:hypothetical protein